MLVPQFGPSMIYLCKSFGDSPLIDTFVMRPALRTRNEQ